MNTSILNRYWIVKKTYSDFGMVIQSFDTVEECKEFLNNALKGHVLLDSERANHDSLAFWYDVVDGDNNNVVLNTTKGYLGVGYIDDGMDDGVVYSTENYESKEPSFVYLQGEYNSDEIDDIIESNKKYDVVFDDDSDSNSKGFRESYQYCLDYILMNNGTEWDYFADYKGGIVSIKDTETEETVYSEDVK